VSAALESLAEGTTYHFRISATNAGGTSLGSDQTFTTTLVLGPYWYLNGTKVGEEVVPNPEPILWWGTLTLTNASTGTLKCETLAGARVENPVGGGAGKGVIEDFTPFNCVAPACEAAGGKAEAFSEKVQWTSVLIEEASLVRDKLEGIRLGVLCAASKLQVQFRGSLKPSFGGGGLIGAAPSELTFGAGSGSLESTAGAGEIANSVKIMGFEGGALLKVKKT
jgi:hypothetical protein